MTAGAPFAPATEHSDGPTGRPRQKVPPADPDDEQTTGDEAHAEPGEEDDG